MTNTAFITGATAGIGAATDDRLITAPLRSISRGNKARVKTTSPVTLVSMALVSAPMSAS